MRFGVHLVAAGKMIEGDVNAWPLHYGDAVLPAFDSFNRQVSYVEVFAEGTRPIDFTIEAFERAIGRLRLDGYLV